MMSCFSVALPLPLGLLSLAHRCVRSSSWPISSKLFMRISSGAIFACHLDPCEQCICGRAVRSVTDSTRSLTWFWIYLRLDIVSPREHSSDLHIITLFDSYLQIEVFSFHQLECHCQDRIHDSSTLRRTLLILLQRALNWDSRAPPPTDDERRDRSLFTETRRYPLSSSWLRARSVSLKISSCKSMSITSFIDKTEFR